MTIKFMQKYANRCCVIRKSFFFQPFTVSWHNEWGVRRGRHGMHSNHIWIWTHWTWIEISCLAFYFFSFRFSTCAHQRRCSVDRITCVRVSSSSIHAPPTPTLTIHKNVFFRVLRMSHHHWNRLLIFSMNVCSFRMCAIAERRGQPQFNYQRATVDSTFLLFVSRCFSVMMLCRVCLLCAKYSCQVGTSLPFHLNSSGSCFSSAVIVKLSFKRINTWAEANESMLLMGNKCIHVNHRSATVQYCLDSDTDFCFVHFLCRWNWHWPLSGRPSDDH